MHSSHSWAFGPYSYIRDNRDRYSICIDAYICIYMRMYDA